MLNITMARKPLEGTVAANTLKWGTGGINIDASRIACEGGSPTAIARSKLRTGYVGDLIYGVEGRGTYHSIAKCQPNPSDLLGRFPANLILSPAAVDEMDNQSGITFAPSGPMIRKAHHQDGRTTGTGLFGEAHYNGHGDSGGASRYFKQVKE